MLFMSRLLPDRPAPLRPIGETAFAAGPLPANVANGGEVSQLFPRMFRGKEKARLARIELQGSRPSFSSPAFRGRGGARRVAVGGEGLYTGFSKTLTSQAFGLGPSSPVKDGRGWSDLGPVAEVVTAAAGTGSAPPLFLP